LKFVLPFNAGYCIFNFSVLQIGLLAGKVMDLQPDSETTGEWQLVVRRRTTFAAKVSQRTNMQAKKPAPPPTTATTKTRASSPSLIQRTTSEVLRSFSLIQSPPHTHFGF
jgi:hypothetical protein